MSFRKPPEDMEPQPAPMQFHMLVENKMEPVPENIRILNNWGYVSICDADGATLAYGNHMHLSGNTDAIKAWLKSFDGVWVGKGSPMLQRFEVMHIGEGS